MTATTQGRAAASPLTPRAAAIETLPGCARLKIGDILSLLQCSKSTLMRRIEKGDAPAPLPDESQLTWLASDVREWLAAEVVA
ncbi:MAG: hypothetical protein LC121_17805 [Anaerolineae bacterium]|nr:hypothetical protein [Anaerolineae bacterium]